MILGVSAGSNQVGASEICTPPSVQPAGVMELHHGSPAGCVSKFRPPSGSGTHGCLLRVQMCTVGRSQDVSSRLPPRTLRTVVPGLGAEQTHDPHSGQTQRVDTRPLPVVRRWRRHLRHRHPLNPADARITRNHGWRLHSDPRCLGRGLPPPDHAVRRFLRRPPARPALGGHRNPAARQYANHPHDLPGSRPAAGAGCLATFPQHGGGLLKSWVSTPEKKSIGWPE